MSRCTRPRGADLSPLDGWSRPVYLSFMRAAFKGLPPLVLASASPRRKELLQEASFEFLVMPAQVQEIHHEQLTAGELCQINAYRKARAVAKKAPDSLVLAADTLVYLETTLFGKPASLAEALQMLKQLQGRTHHVVTGICLLHLRGHRQAIFAERTAVSFRPLDEAAIRKYLSRVNPLDKAGAYAIQERGELLVEKIAGSYTNVVGLPMERLTAELQEWAGSAPRAASAPPAP
jgi:septum formation protein